MLAGGALVSRSIVYLPASSNIILIKFALMSCRLLLAVLMRSFPVSEDSLSAKSARRTVIPAGSPVAAICSVAPPILRDDMMVLPVSQPRPFCCLTPSQLPLGLGQTFGYKLFPRPCQGIGGCVHTPLLAFFLQQRNYRGGGASYVLLHPQFLD